MKWFFLSVLCSHAPPPPSLSSPDPPPLALGGLKGQVGPDFFNGMHYLDAA